MFEEAKRQAATKRSLHWLNLHNLREDLTTPQRMIIFTFVYNRANPIDVKPII
jgi:hypothetical protein